MKKIKKIKCEECGLEMTVSLDFQPKAHAFCSDWCADLWQTRREEDKKDLTTGGRYGTTGIK